jgi:hypothetical protein
LPILDTLDLATLAKSNCQIQLPNPIAKSSRLGVERGARRELTDLRELLYKPLDSLDCGKGKSTTPDPRRVTVHIAPPNPQGKMIANKGNETV